MRKFLYVCIAAYGIIFIILYNGYGPFVVVTIAFLLPFFLKSILFLLKRKAKVRIQTSYRFHELGEDVEVNFHITNGSGTLPITNGFIYLEYQNLFSGDKDRKKIPFHVKTKEEIILTAKWKALHCGRMKVKIKSVRIYDYFGIFYTKLRVSKKRRNSASWERDVIILPGYMDLALNQEMGYLEAEGDGNLYSKHKKGEDSSEVFSIREYKEGDKLHRIHWNLSYKKNQYMVKEYSLPLECAITIIVDFSMRKNDKRRYEYADAILRLAFSLSFTYVQMNVLHYVVWYDKVLNAPTRRLIEKEEDVHEAFQEILTTKLFEGDEILRNGYTEEYGKEKQRLIYYISSKKEITKEEELLESLSCRKVEWIQFTKKGKKERQEGKKVNSTLEHIQIREFDTVRLEEDVQEWLLSE